jgi:hypothetical protein
MKFSAFYLLSGAMFAAAVLKTSAAEPGFFVLFILAVLTTVLGAAFEACND